MTFYILGQKFVKFLIGFFFKCKISKRHSEINWPLHTLFYKCVIYSFRKVPKMITKCQNVSKWQKTPILLLLLLLFFFFFEKNAECILYSHRRRVLFLACCLLCWESKVFEFEITSAGFLMRLTCSVRLSTDSYQDLYH